MQYRGLSVFGTPCTLSRLAKRQLVGSWLLCRLLTTPSNLTSMETQVFEKLNSKLTPAALTVQDVSGKPLFSLYTNLGGCGSMFNIEIVSKAFAGKNVVQQVSRLLRAIC